ncbi:hypothetical protein SDC9_186022 [bioreactor metagenome]|uniref:Uncharacterized protein n=1 Tax=bioreactor metagenome TaxID=1076179 RepID=A0A645HHI7_9ZZZZ
MFISIFITPFITKLALYSLKVKTYLYDINILKYIRYYREPELKLNLYVSPTLVPLMVYEDE